MHYQQVLDELSQRPMKVDLLTAVAQLEVSIESAATKTQAAELEERVNAAAGGADVRRLEGELAGLREAQVSTGEQVAELKQSRADKASLQQAWRELEAVRNALQASVTREELSGLLTAKQDRNEVRELKASQDTLQAAVVRADGRAQQALDAISRSQSLGNDASKRAGELGSRIDNINARLTTCDQHIAARKAELSGVVKVLRAVLEDAEMRCALDESEGPQGSPTKDSPRSAGLTGPTGVPLLHIKGLSNRPNLAPLSPTSQDKVWVKSNLVPRTEVLGQRRRILVAARHSWVGDTCLARPENTESLAIPGDPERRKSGGASGF